MPDTSTRPQSAVIRGRARILFGTLGSAAIFLGGCAARRAPAIPWSTAILVHPITPQHPPTSGNIEDPVPDLRMEIPAPPGPLFARATPPRPRNTEPAPIEEERRRRLETPAIVPDLTAEESASLQRTTEESLRTAERNLSAATGKALNAMQSDLASKIHSFISDAREAGRAGDWARAQSLAKKAEVLSEQLAE